MATRFLGMVLAGVFAMSSAVSAAPPAVKAGEKWVTTWTASVHGPYPSGNPSAQPDQRFAFPTPAAGANNQTFRLMVVPSVWGNQARLRFSNVYGTKPVTFDGVFAGLQLSAGTLFPGSNHPVAFGGKAQVTVAPGQFVWSDPVSLPFVKPGDPMLFGRRLAVSFHVVGETGPMTWHAKSLTTSYVTAPNMGSVGQADSDALFPYSTASWFFLDAVDMTAPAATQVVVGFGDSITDGTASTMNGDDRWPDVLRRRLLGAGLGSIAVVNAGIGGNQVAGPATYPPPEPFAGGPSAISRLDRDVIGLSGVTHVIWLEGINDFSKNGNATLDAVTSGMRQGVAKLRAAIPGVKVIGATVTSALGSNSPAHGFPEQDDKRKGLNAFIRTPMSAGGVFDGVADFDAATLDTATGGMKAEFVPESTTGGAGDKLHPNRAGYLAMGNIIDLALFAKPAKGM